MCICMCASVCVCVCVCVCECVCASVRACVCKCVVGKGRHYDLGLASGSLTAIKFRNECTWYRKVGDAMYLLLAKCGYTWNSTVWEFITAPTEQAIFKAGVTFGPRKERYEENSYRIFTEPSPNLHAIFCIKK